MPAREFDLTNDSPAYQFEAVSSSKPMKSAFIEIYSDTQPKQATICIHKKLGRKPNQAKII
jgi:hypothetical protein